MFKEDFESVVNGSLNKLNLLKKNPLGYFIASMLAGFFVGFGVLLAFSIGGQVAGSSIAPLTKFLMGISFSIALSLVVIAGGELFTGNNLAIFAGVLDKKVTIKDFLLILLVCFLGNLVGGILLGSIFQLTGLNAGAVGEFILNSCNTKYSLSFIQILARGILCNMLVCLAVWSCARSKSESSKLIMIFLCLFAFITTGFEHCVANMTLFTVGLYNGADFLKCLYNLGVSTLGNMIGGMVFVALPYYLIKKEKNESK